MGTLIFKNLNIALLRGFGNRELRSAYESIYLLA